MMWILDLFATAGFGALTGAVFGWLNKREDRAMLKDTHKHEVDLINARTDAEVKLADKEIESNKVKGELAVEKQEVKAFTTSQITTSFGEAVKSLVRPFITASLLYVSYQLVIKIDLLIGGLSSLPAEKLVSLYEMVILQIFGLTGLCVGWWFSTRTSKSYDRLIENHYETYR